MEQRTLGASGLTVSAVGLGTNTLGRTVEGPDAVAVVRRAMENGITFVDTADIYSIGRSEELVGEAVEGRRHDVVIATKVRQPMRENPLYSGLSRRWIMRAVEDSLRRLRTDYVDLYQAHAPDDQTPLEETLRAFDDLVHQGKVRYVGCSNYKAWELTDGVRTAERLGLTRWVALQQRWNVLEGLDDETHLEACQRLGVGIIPYTPLASGILTGKYRVGEQPPAGTRMADVPTARRRLTDERIMAVERLRAWAEARGHTVAEAAVAYLLSFQQVSSVIIGARSAEQVDQNARTSEWALTPEERMAVDALLHG